MLLLLGILRRETKLVVVVVNAVVVVVVAVFIAMVDKKENETVKDRRNAEKPKIIWLRVVVSFLRIRVE